MVVEAHSGAWSPTARRVLDYLAKGIAAANGEAVEVASLRLAQRISIALHRANARAILKRAASIEVDEAATGSYEAPAEELWL